MEGPRGAFSCPHCTSGITGHQRSPDSLALRTPRADMLSLGQWFPVGVRGALGRRADAQRLPNRGRLPLPITELCPDQPTFIRCKLLGFPENFQVSGSVAPSSVSEALV